MLAVLLSAGAITGCDTAPSDKDIVVIPLNKAQELYNKAATRDARAALFVDPRAKQDYDAAHIRGAQNLALRQVNPKRDRDPQLEKYGVLIVYGDNPGSAPAKAMVKRLLLLGYDDVKWFPGGLEEWREARLPIDEPAVPPEAPAAGASASGASTAGTPDADATVKPDGPSAN